MGVYGVRTGIDIGIGDGTIAVPVAVVLEVC